MSQSLLNRRRFVAHAGAAASALAFPLVGGAQPRTVKVGVLHPVTGALAYSGQQCREGALMALEDINKASSKRRQAKIGTRPGIAKALQNLEAMERAIRAEKIALKRDGEHLRADVRLDGKPSSMVVDPSAEWIKLPDRLAAELGVRPAPNALTVSLPSGNGQSTNARRATIGTLQIGSYAAEGVECLVLPPGADPGPPVLGGLALQRALVEVDGVEATLTLTRVDPPPSATTAPATAKAPPRPPTR